MSKKWDPHKEEILRLYKVENLTVDQVMSHMLQTHGFDQKKPHYEYRLKLWGARKNVKKEVLEYISHQHRKRGPSEDLNFGAYLVDGILLSESRIKRARYRHDLNLSLARKFGRAPSPKLPPGHVVQRTSPLASEIIIQWPESLPWLRFEQRFNPAASQSSRFIQILARAAHSYGLISSMINDESPEELARAIYAASHHTQSSVDSLVRMLPCIPEGPQSSTVNIGLSSSADVATKILKALLFFISNKYAKRSRYPGNELLLLFHELLELNPMVLDHLVNSKDPTSEAIVESLYEAAVGGGAIALIFRLLKAGIDVNALLWGDRPPCRGLSRGKAHFLWQRDPCFMTALQSAASTCNIHLATVLIDTGAKVDLGQPTPLQILCSSANAGHPHAVPFARLLISKGAQVNTPSNGWTSPLEGAAICRNRSLVCFLLQHGATDVLDWRDQFSHTLAYTLEESTHHYFLFPGANITRAPPTSALQLAVMTGNESIAEILIASILKQENRGAEILGQAFVTACLAGDQDLTQLILETLDSSPENFEDLLYSAFFATAWNMNCHVPKVLLGRQAVRRKLQSSSRASFQAAALYGNIGLIMLLHSSGFDLSSGPPVEIRPKNAACLVPPRMASTPLGCAVWMGHKDAIETLLNLGADTVGIDLITAVRTKSLELITHALTGCDDVNMSCDGQSALDIAIQERMGMTTIRKLMNAGVTLQGHELVDAMRRDDQDVLNFLLPGCNILAINARGENILEAACCTGNLEMAFYYFACGGGYSSRALLLAVSRAFKIHDDRFIAPIVTSRHPGPIDEYEASALALSIRMDHTTLVEFLLHDDFRPSTALSTYCGFVKGSLDPRVRIGAKVCPLNYENSSMDIQKIAPKPCLCRNQPHMLDCRWQFSPLLVAVGMAQERVVKRMLQYGYRPDPYLLEMLFDTSSIEKEIRDVIMSTYVAQIAEVVDEEWHRRRLLPALAYSMDLEIIQQHIAKLPSLDFLSTNDDSLLFSAVSSGSHDHVRAVLEAGATADARKWHHRAIYMAIEMESLELVSLLLDHGLDVNTEPHDIFAHCLDNLSMVVFFLDHGLDINTPLSERVRGATSLERAAELGTIDAVELLFSRGLDVRGRARIHLIRAVEFAARGCHYAMVKLLKERGGWNDEDDELAKRHRRIKIAYPCARVLYADPTLPRCSHPHCNEIASSIFDVDEEEEENDDDDDGEEGEEGDDDDDDDDTITSLRSYEAADECLPSNKTPIRTDEMSTSNSEPEFNCYEQTNEIFGGPPVTYVQQDIELDVSMFDINSEFNFDQQTNRVPEWPLILYGQMDRELDTIVEGFLLEDILIP